jgi:hypothetical protein
MTEQEQPRKRRRLSNASVEVSSSQHREIELGISEYTTPHLVGFHGILKQRYVLYPLSVTIQFCINYVSFGIWRQLYRLSRQ